MNVSAAQQTLIVERLRTAGCVFAENEMEMIVSSANDARELNEMLERRIAGFPVEQIVGWTVFCGVRIALDRGVFVPRRRSEFLVQEAVAVAKSTHTTHPPVVVDLCCGSGGLSAAIVAALGDVELLAVDCDPVAVRCASRNLGGATVYQGDLYAPLPDTLKCCIDIIVANVPYVPTDELRTLPAEARLHEPQMALDGGKDGLDVLRRVAAGAPQWLRPGGHLFIETSSRQAPTALQIFASAGLIPHESTSSEFDATVVTGYNPDVITKVAYSP